MNNNTHPSSSSELRKIFWPIEWHENKKFLPMAGMMFFILFNYSMLRSIKDAFVVTGIGPESISFLKTYVVLPSAIVAMVLYSKLCNIMTAQKVFYTVSGFFVGYLAFFAFVLYPNPDFAHPDAETIRSLAEQFPNFQWFIKIVGKWGLATFYTISELWGSMMLTLLFWQFANQITKTEEAKRFYSMFGLIGNLGLLCTGGVIDYYLAGNLSKDLAMMPLFYIAVTNGVMVIILYRWINANVLTDPALYSPADVASPKKKKAKLSLGESFKLIFSSKYLGMIAILVLCYGVSVNLIEGIWKAKIRELCPTQELYTMYMGNFQKWQGIAAIFFMIVGSNILRRVSWKTAAILTPLMMMVTGGAFFAFVLFDKELAPYMATITVMQPLALGVTIGMIQNVLTKGTKYSLFDSTKEMSYIPLDDELKSKGKAAVDVVGGRFGKSGGGIIQSTFFIILPSFTFADATPYFAGICMLVIFMWLYGVKSLSKEYERQIADHKY